MTEQQVKPVFFQSACMAYALAWCVTVGLMFGVVQLPPDTT